MSNQTAFIWSPSIKIVEEKPQAGLREHVRVMSLDGFDLGGVMAEDSPRHRGVWQAFPHSYQFSDGSDSPSAPVCFGSKEAAIGYLAALALCCRNPNHY